MQNPRHAPRSSRRFVVIALILCCLVLLGFAYWRRSSVGTPAASSANAEQASPSPAKVAAVYRVKRRDLKRTITLSAELHPYQVANLFAKVSGYLKSINVDYGSRVHTGEIVATLELPEQQAELERTETAYRLAKVSYDRILSVVNETPGMLAQQDVDNARAAYESARDERNRASVMLDYTNIIAPFDGVVTKRNVDLGALIQQGDPGSNSMPIVQIADDNRLRLIVEAPESIVPFVNVGTPVTVKIQGTNQSIETSVARLSYDVHQQTRTMHTEIDIANPDLHLKPGMYADVTITLAKSPNALAVPTQAVLNNDTNTSSTVFVVNKNDVIEQRSVVVGLQTPNWVEIRSGLQPGDLIYLGDRSSVSIGATVKPKIDTTAGA